MTKEGSTDKQDNIMERNNLDFMAMIKECRKGGYRNWSQLLIPFCQSYFEHERPLRYIQSELLRLYQLDISIHTLKYVRTKYNNTKSIIPESKL
jgi:hypothetical protein